MGCNRAGGGEGYGWEPGQTHLPLDPLDQSHFPFLSLNLPLLVLLSFSFVLFKEKQYVMGKFNSIRKHLQPELWLPGNSYFSSYFSVGYTELEMKKTVWLFLFLPYHVLICILYTLFWCIHPSPSPSLAMVNIFWMVLKINSANRPASPNLLLHQLHPTCQQTEGVAVFVLCAYICAYAWERACLLSKVARAAPSDRCRADTLHSGTATPKPRSHNAWLSVSKHPSIHSHSTLPEPSDLLHRHDVWVAGFTMLMIVMPQWNITQNTQSNSDISDSL